MRAFCGWARHDMPHLTLFELNRLQQALTLTRPCAVAAKNGIKALPSSLGSLKRLKVRPRDQLKSFANPVHWLRSTRHGHAELHRARLPRAARGAVQRAHAACCGTKCWSLHRTGARLFPNPNRAHGLVQSVPWPRRCSRMTV